MNTLTKTEKTGLAATLVTELAMTKLGKKDQIWILPEHFEIENIGIDKILSIISCYDERRFLRKAFERRSVTSILPEAKSVLEKLKDHAPNFSSLPRLRALEGIKTFDLYFGSDHAEAVMYEWVEEAIFEDIAKLEWFGPYTEAA